MGSAVPGHAAAAMPVFPNPRSSPHCIKLLHITLQHVMQQMNVSTRTKQLEQVFFRGCQAYDTALEQFCFSVPHTSPAAAVLFFCYIVSCNRFTSANGRSGWSRYSSAAARPTTQHLSSRRGSARQRWWLRCCVMCTREMRMSGLGRCCWHATCCGEYCKISISVFASVSSFCHAGGCAAA